MKVKRIKYKFKDASLKATMASHRGPSACRWVVVQAEQKPGKRRRTKRILGETKFSVHVCLDCRSVHVDTKEEVHVSASNGSSMDLNKDGFYHIKHRVNK